MDQLPIRTIGSNIEIATYQLAKYLAKILSPLSLSQCTIKSTIDFIQKIHNVNVPHGFNMISFDVKSLVASVPLGETINVALDRIYHRKEIETSISKNDMRNLLCTKNVHFCFGGEIYQQNDGVAMGSPLGPVLAGILMAGLETKIIQQLQIAFLIGEDQTKLPFLEILLIRRGTKIEATVYRNSTNNDIYLNWGSFAPVTWKSGTLKTLFNRAYIVCSTDYHLKKELDH